MCGRFTQYGSWTEIYEWLNLIGPALEARPRYNIAPSQEAAVVRAEEGGRRLAMLRWGLIPGWARDPAIGNKLINARVETASVKPSFRTAFRVRRCLVPTDGFYEWTRRGKLRQPWLIGSKDGGPFAFAGLWESWALPEGVTLGGSLAEYRTGDLVETFTILTTAANTTLRSIHHRMPVIISPDEFGPWLSGASVSLGPAPEDLLAVHPVSPRVNSPRHDGPECISPIALS